MKKDWFGRKEKDAFTSTDDYNRIGSWDDDITDEKSYSSFLLKEGSDMQDAAQLLGAMYKMIGVGNKVTPTATVANTVDKVHVPLELLKDKDGKYVKELYDVDNFLGSALQNAALASLQTRAEYKTSIDKSGQGKKNMKINDFMYSLINNERVMDKFASKFPGYNKFIQRYKKDTFEEKYEPLPEEASDRAKLLDVVSRMIRYPASVTEEEQEEYKRPLAQIEKMFFKEGGIPKTSERCEEVSDQITKVIYNYVKEADDEEEPPKEEEQPQSGPGEAGQEPGEGENSKGILPGGQGFGDTGESKSLTQEELDELEKYSKELMKSMGKEEEVEGKDDDTFQDFKNDMEGTPPKSSDERIDGHPVNYKAAKDDKTRYQEVLKKIDIVKCRVLANLFKRKSKDYSFSLKGMRSGRLDTNKIAEAIQHVQTIYEKIGEVKTNKICVGVLIDESGSMGRNSKINRAQEAAIFINETFNKLPDVELFIYGHTADEGWNSTHSDTGIIIYTEPGTTSNKYALGSVYAKSNNRDGHAIISVAKRMRKWTQNEGVLIVISDGAPAASGYNNGMEDTRKKVLEAERLGFQVIQIAIDEYVPSAKMFTHFVKMTNIKDLPNDLVRFMSRKIDKMIRTKVRI